MGKQYSLRRFEKQFPQLGNDLGPGMGFSLDVRDAPAVQQKSSGELVLNGSEGLSLATLLDAYGELSDSRFTFSSDVAPLDATGSFLAAMSAMQDDYTPLTDMRASRDYRLKAAQNLLRKVFLESQTTSQRTRILQVT